MSRYEKAIEYHELALAIQREVKSRIEEGITLDSLGTDYYGLGRYEKAIEYYEQALAIRREVKDRVGEAATLYNSARAERAQGNLLSARAHIEESLKIAEPCAPASSARNPAPRFSPTSRVPTSFTPTC